MPAFFVSAEALSRASSRSAIARTCAPISSRSSASASVASTKPILLPQSKRRPAKVTAWNGCWPIIRAIASVSWISPPAPLPWFSSVRITSGWRM